MIRLSPNETVALTMRRHWIVFAGPAVVFVLLLAAPAIFLVLAPSRLSALTDPAVFPFVRFFLALYFMSVLALGLIIWINYYLDVWVITNRRIIDIEQHRLFHREVSEISLDRVQNVTVEIPGLIATFLEFGNIKIQTAGAGEFTITSVSEFDRAKDLILRYSRHPVRDPADGAPEILPVSHE